MRVSITRNPRPASAAALAAILSDLRFGEHFTDHMFTADFDPHLHWHAPRIEPYGPLSLDPATSVLHYGQEIFEGVKAYGRPDGTVWAFRPAMNARRMVRSARRMAMPELPEELFMASLRELARADRRWVPGKEGESLYFRPFMIARDPYLGVRPSASASYHVIASPAGDYFPGAVAPVRLWLADRMSRVASGGTGEAKTGGNYAAAMASHREATAHGCQQMVFVDDVHKKWIQELASMNIFFVFDDGTAATPELEGTILPGIVRDAVIRLLAERGTPVVERRVAVDEWREGVASGRIREVFACGTAASVVPVGELLGRDGSTPSASGGDMGPVTAWVRDRLRGIQSGRHGDPHGWMERIA